MCVRLFNIIKILFSQIGNIFLKNKIQKIAAIFIAFIIWGTVNIPFQGSNYVEYQLTIPVSYTNLPQELVIVSSLAESVGVRIKTRKINDDKIRASNFQCNIDLRNIKVGEVELPITEKFIQSQVDFELISVNPGSLKIATDEIVELKLQIRPVINGFPANNQIIAETFVNPETITIRTAKSVAKNLPYINTQSIEVDGINNDRSVSINIQIPPHTTILDEINTVEVFLKLGAEQGNLLIENIPIGILGNRYVARINPKTFNVVLRGPKNLLEAYKQKKTLCLYRSC